MIFPMTKFNYMNWYMMQDYIHIDTTTGVTAQDPGPRCIEDSAGALGCDDQNSRQQG